MYRRLHELAAFAERKRVRLMIDAEQTYAPSIPAQLFCNDLSGTCSPPSTTACISCSAA
jgi:hypothetical protein